MRYPLLLLITAAIGILPDISCADQVRLTLADSIRMAVEKNLEIRVERYTPAQREAEYRKALGIYDPALTLQTSVNENTAYSFSSASGNSWSRTVQLNAGISRLLPTGGTASVSFNNSSYQANQESSSVSSYWQSGLGMTFIQPLLKNFGRDATELNINVARLARESSVEKLATKLVSLVAQVRTEYFKLFSLMEELEVRRVSLALARKILADTEGRVKAGVLPAMEVLNAEYGVAAREKELIDAEKAVNDQADLLRLTLQLETGGDIVIADRPSREAYNADEQKEIQKALAERTELKELRRGLESLELQTKVSSDKTNPDLSLSVSASTNGLGTAYSKDIERLSSTNYPSWGIGLTLTYPLGNRVAENEYRLNRLKVQQAYLQIRSQEAVIVNDVKAAVRAIRANYKQLEVADRGRSFAEARLKAFAKKVEVGLATTKELLDVENDLAVAKNNQIKAGVEYANSVTQLWKSTGELLAREKIRLSTTDADLLYRKLN